MIDMKARLPVIVVCVFIFGAIVGYRYEDVTHTYLDNSVRSRTEGKLTSPLLECGVDVDEITSGQRKVIEKDVQTFVDQSKANGTITKTAIYFRDLNNGPWFGINEREYFMPGSLLKLPIAIALYWWEQREGGVLDKTIDFKGFASRPADTGSYGTDAPLNPGVYSVRDLISIMLKQSSNDAAQVLSDYAGDTRLAQVYEDLGIDIPNSTEYGTTVKSYGSFLRVLFNATYIGQPASEALLATLTQADFRDGLVAGVPNTVKVAHKFGTRLVESASGHRQLHDCGIVYVPKDPYVLCVMTQGESVEKLEYFIAQVSKRVYEGVTAE